MWKTAADQKRFILIIYLSFMTQWCGNNVISYYLSLILDSVGVTSSDSKTLVNGILQIVSWIAAVIGSMLVDRLGRRFLWLYSLTVMLLSYVVWTVCSALYEHNQSHGLAIAVLALIFLFQIHYSFGITPLSMSKFSAPPGCTSLQLLRNYNQVIPSRSFLSIAGKKLWVFITSAIVAQTSSKISSRQLPLTRFTGNIT